MYSIISSQWYVAFHSLNALGWKLCPMASILHDGWITAPVLSDCCRYGGSCGALLLFTSQESRRPSAVLESHYGVITDTRDDCYV